MPKKSMSIVLVAFVLLPSCIFVAKPPEEAPAVVAPQEREPVKPKAPPQVNPAPERAEVRATAIVTDAPPAEVAGPYWKKNYRLGERSFARVGEPAVRASEYIVSRWAAVRASNDFTIEMAAGGVRQPLANAADLYTVEGTTTIGGVDYLVVYAKRERILVAPDGTVTKSLRRADSAIFDAVISPATTTFANATRREALPGELIFELLYSGIDGDSIRISYREYTARGIARPAFSQELSYDKTQSEIAFRAIRIRIDEVASSGISYTVLEDGLPEE